MQKILVEVKNKALSFSLYSNRQKAENLNDTNIINTEKMVFSDKYISENLDLIKSFFNLVVIKNDIDTVNITINAISSIVFTIINDIPNIENIYLLEDNQVTYTIFQYLLKSKYIKKVNCYSIPSFMFDKLDIYRGIKITSRCEILYISKFMEQNNINNYSDVYYKKNINIDCNIDKLDREDIESFFRINNNLKTINLFNINKDSVNYIFKIIDQTNKKNVKIILNQNDNDENIIAFFDNLINENKKLMKTNGLRLKINYTKEYRDKNILKQVNINFFRFILGLFIIISVSLIVIFYFKNKGDTKDINDEIKDLDEIIDLNQVDNYIEEEEKIVEKDVEEEKKETKPKTNSKPSPYYQHFQQVFSDLLKINNETVGWLKVNNTNINYPVTKHSDNDYYLHNSYYKQRNSHGWIFMDYRNNINTLDKNTIIYGHRNNYGIMFGTLKNVLNEGWYTNSNNQIITFNTLNKNMKWKIFSIYTLKNTNDYLIVNFNNDNNYMSFLNKIKKRSIYNFNVNVGVKDKILTLSTCYNNAEYRLVVHAKLIQ